MKELEFGQDSTLPQILESIKASEEDVIKLVLPKDSAVYKNPINKEIIENYAKKSGKDINFAGAPVIDSEVPKEVDDFGFVEGKDITEQSEKPRVEAEKSAETEKKTSSSGKAGIASIFSRIKGRKKILILGGAGLSFLLVLFFAVFWFVPSADVKIVTESESKTNQITLTASPNVTEVDNENKIIPLTVEEVTKSGEESADATGKLTIGAPAKGRITIGNFSTVTSKKYSAGTTVTSLTGQNTGLEFTLDTAVTVPKATSSGFSIVAGQSGVNITAKKIGSEGNLPASTEFQIGSESTGTVKGVNDLALTGGESKEVTAVSEEDRVGLKESLLEKLTKEAEEELENKLEGSTIPEGGLSTEIVEENFDKAVGEEADKVSLTLEVRAVAKLFHEDDMKNILISSIEPTIPQGLVVDFEASTVESELFETEGEEDVEILGKIDAVLVPDIDEASVKSNLSGKSFGAAESYLRSVENISEFEIQIKPAIFRLFNLLPFNGGRISVDITPQENFNEEVDTESEN